MTFDLATVVISVLASVVASVTVTGLTFYLKEYLQGRSDYGKVKQKLAEIAGKGAKVVYSVGSGLGMGAQVYRIEDFDREGVTLRNEVQTVFVPASKLVQSDWIIPSEKYEEAKLAIGKQDVSNMLDAMFPAMLERMKQGIEEAMLSEGGDLSAVIGVKVRKALKEEGLEIKQIRERGKKE